MKTRVFLSILLVAITASVSNSAWAGHNSLLSLSRDGKQLLVANTDNKSVTLVDTSKKSAVREIAIPGKPESVAWIGNGPTAILCLYDVNKVVIVDTNTGKLQAEIATPHEPYGVVTTANADFAYVTCDYPGLVLEIDLGKREIVRSISVGKWARGIALLPDESQLLVTHYYTGEVSAVDRKSHAVVDHWKPGPFDNLARQIAVHPTFPIAYVPHVRSRIERAHGRGSIFPFVSMYDLVRSEKPDERRHAIPMDTYVGTIVTANPWETTISPDGKTNYTVFAGTNDIMVSQVVNDNYRYLQPVGRFVRTGSNPRAIAVSPDSQTVYVLNALDFAVAVYNASPFQKESEIKVCKSPFSESMLRGKVLFNLARNPMTRINWISCSSCHPDGDHDGRAWQNPEGLRRTTHLFGMTNTYPLHWSADRDELQDFEHTIRGPLMQGRGLLEGELEKELGKPIAGKSADLDALAEYCNSFGHKLSPHALGNGKLTPAAERGKAIFFSPATNCASCHSGKEYTDQKVHDVGTGTLDPSEKMGPKYDTPTLHRIYRNTAYLHHGKAKSIQAIFTDFNKGDQHGKTSHLTKEQIDDLAEFLKSLPFEN